MENNNIIYGKHSVKECLKTNKGQKLYLQTDLNNQLTKEVQHLAKKQNIPITYVPKSKLDKLTNNNNHQGLVLSISDYQYKEISTMLNKVSKKDEAVFLILDHLEDPHNFGSILRTADATQVDGIIIPKDRAVGITPTVVKTSTGAIEHLDIARVTNLKNTIQQLKNEGFWIFGTDMKGTEISSWKVNGKIALIIGNEGKGMSKLLRKEVDEMITIPMSGHVQSLNASVAASLLMYHIYQNKY